MAKVLLAADRTLISDYHHHEFVGFGTCAPPNVILDWLYSWLFFSSIKMEDDFIKTIELMNDLKDAKSLYKPFVRVIEHG